MTTSEDKRTPQTGSEEPAAEPLLDWFDDQEIQERIARLIAKSATTVNENAGLP